MRKRINRTLAIGIFIPLLMPHCLADQLSLSKLAKISQVRVVPVVSIPFQNDFNFTVGPSNDMQYVLQFQPVIPIPINHHWAFYIRTKLPYFDSPSPKTENKFVSGLGDMTNSFIISTLGNKLYTWGVGPTLISPVATQAEVSDSGKWSAGPSLIFVLTPSHGVIGIFIYNVWSFSGAKSHPDVNEMSLRYTLSYILRNGWYLTSSPTVMANWKAPVNQRWVVPVGGGFGKAFYIGNQAINFSIQGFYNILTNASSGRWTIQATLNFLFPDV